jgi:glycosyltransferase involved in cell wall biosynthesis
MRSTRILHVMNDFSDSSISRIVERVIRSLKSDDYEWYVGALNETTGLQSVFKELGAEVIHFLPQQNIRHCLRSFILDHDIKIIHTHTPRAIIETFLSTLGMKVRPRHVATKHLLTTSKDRRWGVVFTALDYLSLYLPDHLAAVSGGMSEKIAALPGMGNGRVSMVRNAIPCEEFYRPQNKTSARQEFGLDAGQLLFGYAGRIEPVKLLNLLLQTFANIHALHPDTRLMLIGEGSQRADLEQYSRQLGIEKNVFWLGHRTDVPNLLAAMDVYIQPSHNEGMSLSILEAMAAGKPVIATDVGGIREVLRPHENGLLISPHSTESLFEAMLELIDHPELRILYGQVARKQVFAEFSLQKMVDAYGQIYRTLLTGE